jgi:molybdate transport system ATP-binding protein
MERAHMSFELRLSRSIGDARIDIDVAASGAVLGITGPSGAGKTSLLNCVAGLLKPETGRIAVAGEVLFDSAASVDLPPDKRRAGYLFQDNRLFPHLKVADNLAYGEKLATPDHRWMSREEAVELLGIGPLLGRFPPTLSGGEARRVALGRALLSGPRFLLLDEPLAHLDAPRGEEIMRMIERVRDELRVPMLYVSHVESEVARLADEVVRLGQRSENSG